MIRVFPLIVMVVYLVSDFKKTKGYYKAKFFHGLVLTFLIYYYSTAFAYLGSLLRKGDQIISKYNIDVGLMSANVNVTIWAGQVLISCVILFCAFGLTVRKEKSRELLIKILPFAFIFESFGFYRGFVEGGDIGLNHYLIFGLGLIIIGLINGSIFFLYKSKFMDDFFKADKSMTFTDRIEKKTNDNNELW